MLSSTYRRNWLVPTLAVLAGALAAMLVVLVSGPASSHAGGTPQPEECTFGDSGDDRFVGGPESDCYDGEGGDDRIFGRGGGDLLFGGDGDDIVDGEEGDDELYGDGGFVPENNLRRGVSSDGEDFVHGRAGDDTIFGGGCDDELLGGPGQDDLDDTESSSCFSNGFKKRGNGPPDVDILRGGPSGDTLDADDGDGDDVLRGGAGSDQCFGDEGDQQFSCEENLEDRRRN